MTDLLVVVGARPNFMKAAPVLAAATAAGLSARLVHTGQHYDPELSRVFFDELGMPEPDVSLGVGSGTHAAQTARIMLAFEGELERLRPRVVVVVGDVNSTLACALVASKQRYPVAHVEAGLRCYDPWMPEEINRRLTDHLSAFLFTTSRDANENLALEGIPADKVHLVGNTMIDTLLRFRERARERLTHERLGVDRYALLTLHRPDNVDSYDALERIVETIQVVGRDVPVVFPVHPRTRAALTGTPLERSLERDPGIRLTEPLGYLDFLSLLDRASVVLTDSGGIQEETTVLGVRCVTLRESTERPVTVTSGTNVVVGTDPDAILRATREALARPAGTAPVPELWDGCAAERIVAVLQRTAVGAASAARV